MIVAVKDDLQIEMTANGKKVKIQLPDMQEVLVLWESWIKQEELSAEKHLGDQHSSNSYAVLEEYLRNNGWEVIASKY